MKTISTWDVLSIVYHQYIKKIRLLRLSIGPIMILMIFARLMEIKVTELVQKASKDIGVLPGSNIHLQYLLVSILSSFLVESQGFFFTSSVQAAYRTAIKNSISDYLKLEYKVFKNKGIGEITSNIDRQSLSISEILDVFILNLLPVMFIFLLSIIKIYSVLGLLASIIIAITIVLYTFITIQMAVLRNQIRKNLNLSYNESKDKLMDILKNYDTIVAFNKQNYEIERYNEKLQVNEKWSVHLWQTFYILNFLQKAVFCLKTGIIIYMGLKNGMKSDEFVLFLSVSRVLGVNLDKLGYMYSRFTSAILNAQMGFLKVRKAKQLYPIHYFNQTIQFKNVGIYSDNMLVSDSNKEDRDKSCGSKSADGNMTQNTASESKRASSYNPSDDSEEECFFTYEQNQFIFDKIDLKIEKGNKIALIGPNGVGKSNFLKILLKFNKYSGSIKIDNDELSTVDSKSIRDLISYIPQDCFLICGTVKENLLYGNGSVTENDMIRLAKYLNYDESFRNLSSGYDTYIGKNNSILSGGEKQKIAIIRAFLKRSQIYLFDEPTANLDKNSEAQFFNHLFNHEREKTAIVVVHNLDLLERFDRIMFLKKNGIDEVTKAEAITLLHRASEKN